MLGHQPGPNHPERPARLAAVMGALDEAIGLDLDRREAPEVAREALERVHPGDFIDALDILSPRQGLAHIDGDTALSPGSLTAARRAAGAVVAAVEAVAAGEAEQAFCAVRPPGHHAEPDRAMGFLPVLQCQLSAHGLPRRQGWQRVAIARFPDVHHGNGTQAVAFTDPSLFFASVHQWPLRSTPGSGLPEERGVGNVRNAIVQPVAPRQAWRAAFESLMAPLDGFVPDLILISAGFRRPQRRTSWPSSNWRRRTTPGRPAPSWIRRTGEMRRAYCLLARGRLLPGGCSASPRSPT